MALQISIGGIVKRIGFFAIWWMKQRKNGKSSQTFCFKLLKDGNLLCEALSRIVVTYHLFSQNLE